MCANDVIASARFTLALRELVRHKQLDQNKRVNLIFFLLKVNQSLIYTKICFKHIIKKKIDTVSASFKNHLFS
jgi:hypothetical protein